MPAYLHVYTRPLLKGISNFLDPNLFNFRPVGSLDGFKKEMGT